MTMHEEFEEVTNKFGLLVTVVGWIKLKWRIRYSLLALSYLRTAILQIEIIYYFIEINCLFLLEDEIEAMQNLNIQFAN